ncbi:hypothetical protein EON66_02835 [archaeon]|nr:MAG: hypothetical protein EON66_02835 [archaeon]
MGAASGSGAGAALDFSTPPVPSSALAGAMWEHAPGGAALEWASTLLRGLTPSTHAVNDVRLPPAVEDMCGTKLSCVLRRLLSMPSDEKAVVVCTWSKMLSLLASACERMHIGHVSMTGAPSTRSAACHAFAHDVRARVMFLSSQTDCSGLTLTSANHLFILGTCTASLAVCRSCGHIRVQSHACAMCLHLRGACEQLIMASVHALLLRTCV